MLDFKSDLGQKARSHIDNEYFVWLTTVDSHSMPQPRPVWFVWHEGAFIIYSQPGAFKLKHIRANPQVSLHFNTPDPKGEEDVIVFGGTAEIVADFPPAHLLPSYIEKYASGIEGLNSNPEKFGQEYSVVIHIVPASLRGW
jgi:PPOX class probable F420-dependent enzyme